MKKLTALVLAAAFTMPMTAMAEDSRLGFLEDYFEITELNFPYSWSVSDIGDGVITVSDDEGNYYAADMTGNPISEIPLDYVWVGAFENGIAPARKFRDGKEGYINTNGEYVIKPQFDNALSFSQGYACVEKDRESGYINEKGELVKNVGKDANADSFTDGYGITRKYIGDNLKSTVYDTSFNELFTVDGYIWFTYIGDGIFTASESLSEDESKTVLFDNTGKKIAELSGSVGEFIGGKAVLMTDESIKIIDKTGKTLASAISEGDYISRCADNLNAKSVYHEETDSSDWIFYDDTLKQVGELKNCAMYMPTDKYTILNDNEAQKKYILKDKNYSEPQYTLPENLPVQKFSDNAKNKTEILLKIGDERAFVDGLGRFIEEAYNILPGKILPKTFLQNDRTMVPVRFLSEAFYDYGIEYDESTRCVSLGGEKQIELYIDNMEAKVTEFDEAKNDYVTKEVTLDSAPVIREDRTFVPIRFISEVLGYKVDYNDGIVLVSNDANAVLDSKSANAKFAEAEYTYETYPVIDGSTATLPLAYALASHMLGISPNQAENITHHSKTENAYNNLISGKADMLITGEPNAERIAKAKEQGVEFETYDFALDGFVFMINNDNPVTNLTTGQIQDIYQGKITNWKELGGEDAQIIPFQRNEDSGSQAHMRNDFMKGLKMIDPKTNRINAMGEIIDMVAEYDNAKDSIGYTVYYYLSKMHTSDNVKALGVDGVIPTDKTIRAGEYPYIIRYSIVIRKDEPQDSEVRKIIEFLKSDEGKALVKNAGFVNAQ